MLSAAKSNRCNFIDTAEPLPPEGRGLGRRGRGGGGPSGTGKEGLVEPAFSRSFAGLARTANPGARLRN